MALWVLIVWLVVGIIAGLITRKLFARKSSFGNIGDDILGAAGGVIGGYIVALSGVGSTLQALILTVGAAILGAAVVVWSTKFITKP